MIPKLDTIKTRFDRVKYGIPRGTANRNITVYGDNKEYHATKGWRKGTRYGKA